MTERATIYTDRERGVIAPEIYGHFIEHLGRCIYDGIWVGRKSKIPNIDGIRQEAIDILKAVKAPLIRWPGGYFADCYDWRDGIGPLDQRPIRFHECEPNHEEPNQFGTHEFMQLCELTGAKPNLCVNTATLSAQDAMNWVEYCNHDGRTSFAQSRRKNGRPAPWQVKFWAIGNESYLLHRPQDYVQKYLLWRKYMRRVDKEIKCIASLVDPTAHPKPFSPQDDWFHEVIKGIRENMELASLHLYTGAGHGAEFNEAEYWSCLAKIDQRNRLRIESFLGAIDSIAGDQHIKLALDEWGLWHPGASMWDNYCEQPCTQRDAVFAARYFHLLQRYPDRIELATIAQSVNVLHALLRTEGPRTYRTPTFHVFEMFKDHQGGKALALTHSTPQVEVDKEIILTTRNRLDMVTFFASRKEQQILVTMTNADLRNTCQYEIEFIGQLQASSGEARVLFADPHAQNTFANPDQIKPKELKFGRNGSKITIELPPCSITALKIA